MPRADGLKKQSKSYCKRTNEVTGYYYAWRSELKCHLRPQPRVNMCITKGYHKHPITFSLRKIGSPFQSIPLALSFQLLALGTGLLRWLKTSKSFFVAFPYGVRKVHLCKVSELRPAASAVTRLPFLLEGERGDPRFPVLWLRREVT